MNTGRIGLGLGLLAWGVFIGVVMERNLREEEMRRTLESQWRFHRWISARKGVTREEWLQAREHRVRFWIRYGKVIFAPPLVIWCAISLWVLIEGL